MGAYFVISAGVILAIFVLFLVLGRTLNGTLNQLAKIEILLANAFEYKKEHIEIQRMLDQQVAGMSEEKK